MGHDYQNRQATETMRQTPSKAAPKAGTEVGREALARCKAMLEEMPKPVEVYRGPCEHDFQPSSTFADSLQCTWCASLISAPEPPDGLTRTDQPPIDGYGPHP